MSKSLVLGVLFLLSCSTALAITAVEGRVEKIDRAAKTMSIKTADGTEEAFRLSSHAAQDAGRDTEDATKKSAQVTVYYTEEAGHKVAHFFKAL